MLGKRLFVCSVFLAIVGATSPAAAQPAWCNVPDAAEPRWPSLDEALTAKDPVDALDDIVALMCKPDADATARMGELEAARKRWSAVLELTDADWKDVRVWAGADQSERAAHDFRLDDRGTRDGVAGRAKIAWSALSAIDQFAAMANGLGNDSDTDSKDPAYLADALGDKLTEAGRLGYLLATCAKSEPNPVVLAMCQGDVAALDRKQLGRELRADRSYTGTERVLIRLALYRWERALPAYRAEVKKWTAKDEAYARMFAIAASQRTAWSTRAKTDAALISLVQAMEDARALSSRKAYAGCEDKTWTAVQAAVSAIPAATFANLGDDPRDPFAVAAASAIIGTPTGYLAAVAHHHCHERGSDSLASVFGMVMRRWPGHRGPRTGTATAILLAGLELDDPSVKIDHPSWTRHTGGGGATGGATTSTLASVERQGDRVTLQWVKKLGTTLQCTGYKETNRITQIEPDGRLKYERFCTGVKRVPVDRTPPAVTVNARYAAGLVKGMTLRVVGDAVFAAYKKGASSPVLIAGAPVK